MGLPLPTGTVRYQVPYCTCCLPPVCQLDDVIEEYCVRASVKNQLLDAGVLGERLFAQRRAGGHA
jgi:hypothetical protein